MRHLPDSNSPLSDSASYEFTACEDCEEYSVYDGVCKNRCKKKTAVPCDECASGRSKADPTLCERSCYAKKQVLKNELAMDWDWIEVHDTVCGEWLKRIDRKEGGGFVKHAEVSSTPTSSNSVLADNEIALAKAFRSSGVILSHTRG